jgi:hypothetical protein
LLTKNALNVQNSTFMNKNNPLQNLILIRVILAKKFDLGSSNGTFGGSGSENWKELTLEHEPFNFHKNSIKMT